MLRRKRSLLNGLQFQSQEIHVTTIDEEMFDLGMLRRHGSTCISTSPSSSTSYSCQGRFSMGWLYEAAGCLVMIMRPPVFQEVIDFLWSGNFPVGMPRIVASDSQDSRPRRFSDSWVGPVLPKRRVLQRQIASTCIWWDCDRRRRRQMLLFLCRHSIYWSSGRLVQTGSRYGVKCAAWKSICRA